MQLSQEQRVFIVEEYYRTNSIAAVLNAFSARFPERRRPTRRTIGKLLQKFQARGTVTNQNAGFSGRARAARTPANIELVRQTLGENPELSCRRNGLEISRSTFNRITRLDLYYHPYRMVIRHQIEDFDFHRRRIFCQWFLDRYQEENFVQKIVIGDEATFSMNGRVNTHNIVRYSPKGHCPDFHYDVPHTREKLTVWAALCGNGSVLGPHFFDGNVNGDTYLNMIEALVIPEMNDIFNFNLFAANRYEQEVWWFQDGAPCHRHRLVTNRLTELFGNQIVSLNHAVEWPPRSPDITPCDFFLWGYLKQRVFRTPPATIFVLRERIIEEFDLLRNDPELISRCVRAMETRATICIERDGGHVEGHFA